MHRLTDRKHEIAVGLAELTGLTERVNVRAPAGRDPLDQFIFKWVCGEDESNTDDFKRARTELLAAIDNRGVALSPAPQPVAWLNYDQTEAERGEFPWMVMVNKEHPLIQANTERIELHAAGVKDTSSKQGKDHG